MNALAVVTRGEFVRRVRSRAYIVATIIGAAGVLAVALLPALFAQAGRSGGERRIVLAGPAPLVAAARPLLARDYDVVAVLPPPAHAPDVADLDAYRKAGAMVVLERRGTRIATTVYARDPAAYRGAIRRALGPLQLSLATGVPARDVQRGLAVDVTVRDVAGRFADASAATSAKGFAFFLVMLLYVGILFNAQSIMASVAEEKTSRIAELLVAAIDPAQLLTGKVLAATATGCIQLAVWVAAGAVAGKAIAGTFDPAAPADAAVALGPAALPAGDLVALGAFFVIGFLQYAVLYAGGASLVNRTEDIGTLTGPLVVPVVGALVIAQIALTSPSATSVVVCSEIPLLAPFVMFTRIAAGTVPAWQIALSLVVNVAAAVAFALAAGRVYRVGLLLYGRPPSLRQLVAALRG